MSDPQKNPDELDGSEQPFVSHLVELRDRLIRSLVVVLVLFGVCFYFSGEIMKFLSQPLYQALPAERVIGLWVNPRRLVAIREARAVLPDLLLNAAADLMAAPEERST